MLKLTPLRVVLAGALASPVLLVAPSLAQPACVNGVGTAALVGLGSTGCQIGDKIYSHFTFSSGFSSTGTFNFTNTPTDQHTFSAAGLALAPGSYSYGYKMTIVPGTPGTSFAAYRTGSGTSDVITALGSTKTLIGTSGGLVTAVNDGTSSVYNYSPFVAGPVDFTSTINVTAGRLDIFSDSVVQNVIPTASSTPGPLPILGAAVAFGSVRNLRKFSSALKQG